MVIESEEYMVSNPPKGGNPVVASPEYVQKLRAGI